MNNLRTDPVRDAIDRATNEVRRADAARLHAKRTGPALELEVLRFMPADGDVEIRYFLVLAGQTFTSLAYAIDLAFNHPDQHGRFVFTREAGPDIGYDLDDDAIDTYPSDPGLYVTETLTPGETLSYIADLVAPRQYELRVRSNPVDTSVASRWAPTPRLTRISD